MTCKYPQQDPYTTNSSPQATAVDCVRPSLYTRRLRLQTPGISAPAADESQEEIEKVCSMTLSSVGSARHRSCSTGDTDTESETILDAKKE